MFIRRILSHFFFSDLLFSNLSWSQEGEDQILRRIFERQSTGFYIDVGAHHPMRFSNTYLLYKRGWYGINIDAMPGSMKIFDRKRPRDINLEIGISSNVGQLDYYIFNEPALNSFSKDLSEERQLANTPYKIVEVVKVNVQPLAQILGKHLPNAQCIDFMSIDVEGLDLVVLQSNDWSKFRPKFVLVELLNSSFSQVEQSNIGQFMSNIGYTVYAKCVNTVFFQDSSNKQ